MHAIPFFHRSATRPAWLAAAHHTLDAAVCTAYGWPDDLSDEEILARLPALKLQRAHNTPGVLSDQAQ